MQQGSNAGAALAARTVGMTDEQILDLDLIQLASDNPPAGTPEILPERGGEPELWGAPPTQQVAAPDMTLSDPETDVMTSLGGESAPYRGLSPLDNPGTLQPVPPAASSNTPNKTAPNAGDAQGDPAWLKQLEAQPAAAAEARQWRDAAKDFAALDAAYFSGDAGERSGLAARIYQNDPAAFREMLVESARMLASRDPQALADLARQLGMTDAQSQAPNTPAKSLAQAVRAPELTSADSRQIAGESHGAPTFPADTYRAFEAATNEDLARHTREAIDRTLVSTLPEGVGEGARRRIADDVFRELHTTLSADRELSRRVGEMLRGWQFDGSTRQQVVSLVSGRARAAMPDVARRVISEWTSSVLASDRARAARVDAAAARRDITGGRLPEPVPASVLVPKNVDYARMSDEQILEL
jgi:hypothetical protein